MSSPSLREQLWEAIEPMWAVDFHSHVPIGRESAGSMARLLCYHYSETDAMNAGMPYDAYMAQGDWEAKARVLIPYFPKSIGTTTYAGLHEVARGLFGFKERITPASWEALCEIARAKMAEEGWVEHVMKQNRIAHLFGTNDPFEDLVGAKPWYQVCLRVDRFIHVDELPLSETIKRWTEQTGQEIRSLEGFLEAMAARFRWFREQGAVSIAISLPPDFRLDTKAGSPGKALDRLIQSRDVSTEDLIGLRTRLFYHALDLCREHGFVFQLMLGVVRQVHRGVAHCGDGLKQDPDMFQTFWEPLNAYPDVRFDFAVLAAADQHQLCVLVKNFPNAVMSGLWWYCNAPSIIEQAVRMRLELVGAYCQNGQNTDAYMVEQGYYKMRQYKRALAQVLATMVEDGFFSAGESVDIAHGLLFENPIRHFRLDRAHIERTIRSLEKR